ncbi:uncharacterized protein LOC101846893, partial [Aplysia californica]|uniref:Uncharacterized protein LOC101846893 n=1 Tax=Aplysia californica TaxID=6500 RepID=A0ABM1A4H6_APLCA
MNIARCEVAVATYLTAATLVVDLVIMLRRSNKAKWLLIPGILCFHAGLLVLAAVSMVTSEMNNYTIRGMELQMEKGWTFVIACVAGVLTIATGLLSLFAKKGTFPERYQATGFDGPAAIDQ